MSRSQKISLWLMVLLLVIAGSLHFLKEPAYEAIMPSYIPYHRAMVHISGICEILFGLLLIPVVTRRTAAWLIIVLLIAIFPANIQMTVNYWTAHDPRLWLSIVRLPLQFVLIWWAWGFTKTKSKGKNQNPKVY